MIATPTITQLIELTTAIKAWGRQLRFQQTGIADIDLSEAETRLLDWMAAGFQAKWTLWRGTEPGAAAQRN